MQRKSEKDQKINKKGIGLKEFFEIKGVFNTKSLTIMGMMLALTIALNYVGTIYVTESFKIFSLAYLPGVVVAMLYGPWAAIPFAFAVDTLKFITYPVGGAYFFGYAISEIVADLIYAIFLYKQTVKIWRVTAARVLVMVIVTFGLNYIWNLMMMGQAASAYYTSLRLINNIAQLPVHVALIMFVGRFVCRIRNIKFS